MMYATNRTLLSSLALSAALVAATLAPREVFAQVTPHSELGVQVGASGGLFLTRQGGGLMGVDLSLRHRYFTVGGFYESEQGYRGAGDVVGGLVGVSLAPTEALRVDIQGLAGARSGESPLFGLRACVSLRAGASAFATGGFCAFARRVSVSTSEAANGVSRDDNLFVGLTMRVGAGFDL